MGRIFCAKASLIHYPRKITAKTKPRTILVVDKLLPTTHEALTCPTADIIRRAKGKQSMLGQWRVGVIDCASPCALSHSQTDVVSIRKRSNGLEMPRTCVIRTLVLKKGALMSQQSTFALRIVIASAFLAKRLSHLP